MEKHTAEIFRLTIILALVAGILGETTMGTGTTFTEVWETEVAGTEVTGTEMTGTKIATTQATGVGTTLKPTEKTKTDKIVTAEADKTSAPGNKILRMFEGTLKITKIGSDEANFTEELNDPEDSQFTVMQNLVCNALTAATSEPSLGRMVECKVTNFTEGSIVAAFYLEFEAEATYSVDKLKDFLVESLKNSKSTGMTVDTTSFTLEETTEKEPSGAGWSTGKKAGLVVGSVLGGLLIIAIIAFAIMKCKGGRSKVTQSTQELQPTAQRDAEDGHGDGVVVEHK